MRPLLDATIFILSFLVFVALLSNVANPSRVQAACSAKADCQEGPGSWKSLRLVAPEPISPLDGAVYSNFPRTTLLQWNPVNGASSYTVEIDCFHCCEVDRWCSEVGGRTMLAGNLRSTSYSFQFVGAQPGRWRVWAVDSQRRPGPKTEWMNFVYTR